MSCLRTACSCPADRHALKYRYTLLELQFISDNLKRKRDATTADSSR